MRDQGLTSSSVLVLVIAIMSLRPALVEAQAQTSTKAKTTAKTSTEPRTPWGDPDLQGITWNFATINPLERPGEFAGKDVLTGEEVAEFERQTLERRKTTNATAGQDWWDPGTKVMKTRQSSLVVDPANGRIPPLTPEAQKSAAESAQARRRRGPADSPGDLGLNERCILWAVAGPPMVPGLYNNNVQFVQTRDYVVILNEMIHDARVVAMDGRPHGKIRQWMGDSRGHWEGKTLVVDTINFTDKTSFRGSGENLHLVERFTRVDQDTIDYEFTADDPATWTRPWTARFPMTKTDDLIYEYACHEENYRSLAGIFSATRAQEKATNK